MEPADCRSKIQMDKQANFYKELAGKLPEYKNNRHELVEKVKKFMRSRTLTCPPSKKITGL